MYHIWCNKKDIIERLYLKKRMGKETLDPRIKKVSERIRQLRIDAGYSSYETFANEKHLPRMQYWRAETGANMTLNTILKIADAHGITLKELFTQT